MCILERFWFNDKIYSWKIYSWVWDVIFLVCCVMICRILCFFGKVLLILSFCNLEIVFCCIMFEFRIFCVYKYFWGWWNSNVCFLKIDLLSCSKGDLLCILY